MRIVLSGYYGFDNAGDEALLTAILESLKEVDDSLEITVLSGNPRRTRAAHGVRAVSRVNPLVLFRELLRADLLISGGGSLLQDVTGPLSIPYYLGIVVLAKLLGTPVAFYAQGLGPVRARFGRRLIELVVNHVELITLRDQESADLLRELGVNRVPVAVTADPVFSMRPSPELVQEAGEYLASLKLPHPPVGVALRKWPDFPDEKIADFLDILSQMEYSILLLPLQHPEDLHQARQIRKLMKTPATIAEKPMNSIEMMALIAHMHAVVGMRLHALIFSACMGVPFEGLAYDPKVTSFLKIFGKTSLNQDGEFKPEEAVGRVRQTLINRESQIPDIIFTAKQLKAKSDLTARYIMAVDWPAIKHKKIKSE